tara:strand:+ start:306 stop:476 length:171 start_codon:yes stop_codon:yes gene_type:complete
MGKDQTGIIKNFCMIQLQILQDKKETLRKELLNCKIQEEFLTLTLQDLDSASEPHE